MAKDEHRKFTYCVFCKVTLKNSGGPGRRTAEHIFGAKIVQSLPDTGHWLALNETTKKHRYLKGSSQPKHLTSRSVCEECNSGWMSEEMAKVIPLITNLASGNRFTFKSAHNAPLARYLSRIGIIVDIESSNLDLPKEKLNSKEYIEKFGLTRLYRPILTSEDRYNFMNGLDIPEIDIQIGYHDRILGHSFQQNLIPYTNGQRVIGKRFLFAMGKLVASISVGPTPRIEHRNFIKIPISLSSTFSWPLSKFVSYDDFFAIYHQTDRVKDLRKALSNRHERRRIESDYWRSLRKNRSRPAGS